MLLSIITSIYTVPTGWVKNYAYRKFQDIGEYFYTAFEHSFFASMGLLFFYNRDWFYQISMMDEWEYDRNVYIYYSLYFIRYLAQLINLDKRSKDYHIMAIHHLMTLFLLTVSSFRYTRIGVIIAFNHDICDIPLNLAKGFNKLFEVEKKKVYNILSGICLIYFAWTWILTRMLLNFNILKYIYHSRKLSLDLEPFMILDIDEQLSILLLLLNFSLQCYWQILIIKFFYGIAIGKKPEDEKGISYDFEEEN
jgi:hypothetical protein